MFYAHIGYDGGENLKFLVMKDVENSNFDQR